VEVGRKATYGPDDPFDEWILEEMGKPEGGVSAPFRLLQFLTGPFRFENHAYNHGGHR
jgi:hypothetical protein